MITPHHAALPYPARLAYLMSPLPPPLPPRLPLTCCVRCLSSARESEEEREASTSTSTEGRGSWGLLLGARKVMTCTDG